MQRIFGRTLMLLVAFILTLSNISVYSAPPATTLNLPPGFAALVPKDYKTDSCQTTTADTMAGVSFVAGKPDPQQPVILHEYRLNLNLNVVMSQLLKMRAPIYQAQLEKDIEAKRQSYAAHKSDTVTGYDPAVVTKYPWGYGITQRRAHHYIGGTAPDEIDYFCEYLGLIIDDTSVKKFELLVSGVKTSAEADQWAKNVVAKIGKTTLSNFRD